MVPSRCRHQGNVMSKTIISCAITGGIHTPTMSDALPVTPEAIGRSALEAAEAGAAILHLHARHPSNGSPTGDPAHFAAYLPQLHQATNAVLNITTGAMRPSKRIGRSLSYGALKAMFFAIRSPISVKSRHSYGPLAYGSSMNVTMSAISIISSTALTKATSRGRYSCSLSWA